MRSRSGVGFLGARVGGIAEMEREMFGPVLHVVRYSSRDLDRVIEAVNDDMPFLVDSTTMEINRQGLTLHLIVHPVLVVQRDAGGRLQSLHPLEPGEDPAGALTRFRWDCQQLFGIDAEASDSLIAKIIEDAGMLGAESDALKSSVSDAGIVSQIFEAAKFPLQQVTLQVPFGSPDIAVDLLLLQGRDAGARENPLRIVDRNDEIFRIGFDLRFIGDTVLFLHCTGRNRP